MNKAVFPAGVLACAVLLACSSKASSSEKLLQERGWKIFSGQEPVTASIAGHTEPLPPQAARCINCHSEKQRKSTERFAPLLTRDWLTQIHARHGGPAYAYSEGDFCKTVRSGLSPDYVVLLRTMPRYEIDDAQCRALWTYLTHQDHG
jgi:hypothetical protein